MLTTNSRAASTSRCECREGRIATLSIGGAEHTVPTHARVMMLSFSLSRPATLSSTTGVGSSAVDGLRSIFTWLLLGCGARVARYRTAPWTRNRRCPPSRQEPRHGQSRCGLDRVPVPAAEEQLALLPRQRGTRLIAELVHPHEELAHHHHQKIAPLGRKRERLVIITLERARDAQESHLPGQSPVHRDAEVEFEIALVQPQPEELHAHPVPHPFAPVEPSDRRDGHPPLRHHPFVLPKGERVGIQCPVEVRERARPDPHVLVIVDDVLVDHLPARARERPCWRVLEDAVGSEIP